MKVAWGIALLLLCGACGDGDEQPADADATPDATTGPDAAQMGLDEADFTCQSPGWAPGACAPGAGVNDPDRGNRHVPEDQTIRYDDPLPASGNHRGTWAKWGEYEYLPPQRWLHNLEHGGAVFLYHPCAPAEMVEALRAAAKSQVDPDGEFRWLLTPYPDLPSAVAVVTWTWRYEASCVDLDEITRFVESTYRSAPEDIAADGLYQERWIGD